MKGQICKILLVLICTFFLQKSFAQQKVITGKISDEKGIPLAGATVSVKGEKGVAGDNNGAFSISVPAAQKQLRYLCGYETQTFPSKAGPISR
jgi:hypothetical protein